MWSKQELTLIAKLAQKHDFLVIADQVWIPRKDFVRNGASGRAAGAEGQASS